MEKRQSHSTFIVPCKSKSVLHLLFLPSVSLLRKCRKLKDTQVLNNDTIFKALELKIAALTLNSALCSVIVDSNNNKNDDYFHVPILKSF